MKNSKRISVGSTIACVVLSAIFAGLAMISDVATSRDYRNPYINPDGTWIAKVDWTDENYRVLIANSVGTEIRVLRGNMTRVNQSNNWFLLAAVSGIAAAIIATATMIWDNQSAHATA